MGGRGGGLVPMSLLGPIGELWESWDMPNNISHPQPAYNLPLPLLQAPAYRHNTSLTQIPDPWKETRQRGRSVYTGYWLLCLFLSEKQWVEMKGIAHISPGQILSEVLPSSAMYPNHPTSPPNLESVELTLSKHTRLIWPHMLILCGEIQKIFFFFSLFWAYTLPMVRAAGSTGGTVAVRRISAMVAVSLGGTWRGEKDEYRIEQSGMAPSFQLPPVTLGSPGPCLRVFLGFHVSLGCP